MIKFRAWDNDNESYLYDVQDVYDESKSCFGSFLLDDDLYVVEQFTGLKDVNGKDIYEGDIVQPVSSYVRLKRGKPFEVNKGNYVYDKWTANDVSSKEFGRCYFGNEIQTVGNVHENPELLEAGR